MRFAGLSLPPSARETFDKSSISGGGRVGIKDEAEFPPRPDFSSQITEIPRANSHISRLMRREQRESRRGERVEEEEKAVEFSPSTRKGRIKEEEESGGNRVLEDVNLELASFASEEGEGRERRFIQ